MLALACRPTRTSLRWFWWEYKARTRSAALPTQNIFNRDYRLVVQ